MLKGKFSVKNRITGTIYAAEKQADKKYCFSWVSEESDFISKSINNYSEEEILLNIKNGAWIPLGDYLVEEAVKEDKEETKETQEEINTVHKYPDFSDLTGRRFAVSFKSINDLIYHTPLIDAKLKYVEGYIENFSPNTGVVLNDEKYGFNIIPYPLIVQMIEIK